MKKKQEKSGAGDGEAQTSRNLTNVIHDQNENAEKAKKNYNLRKKRAPIDKELSNLSEKNERNGKESRTTTVDLAAQESRN